MRIGFSLKFLAILGLALSSQLYATTFIPLPIEDQIDATDSVVLATNTGKSYKRLPNGDIVTEYSFQLELASGLPEHKVVSPNAFKVLTPGGQWQGRYYQVHGVASFKQGEKALLFLKQTSHGWVVNNLSMGKFEVLKDTQGTWFRNTVFPTHPKLGLISMSKMNELLEHKFNTPLTEVEIDKYVHVESSQTPSAVGTRGANRAPASIEEEVSETIPNSSYGLMWMMLLLGVLGFIYRVRANKNRRG